MPGRAKTTIPAKELECYPQLVAELTKKGYTIRDNSRLKVTFLAPYQSKPSTDLNAVIKRLDRYVAIHGNSEVKKSELYKILGISRPTLNDWICKYCDGEQPWFYDKIDLNEVKNQLLKMTLL